MLDRLTIGYRAVRAQLPSRRTFFEHLRALTQYLPFDSWEHLFDFMLDGLRPAPRKPRAGQATGQAANLELLDLIVIERRDDAHNGEIVVALIRGQEVTLKRIVRNPPRSVPRRDSSRTFPLPRNMAFLEPCWALPRTTGRPAAIIFSTASAPVQ